jgi:ABC-type transport system substrate-binding protein
MKITRTLLGRFPIALALTAAALSPQVQAADPNKVLRYAFEIAETSFDPQKISDIYSNIVVGGMFDAPLEYDYLARPLKLKPNSLIAMPEISADGLTYTLRVKPGIYFIDDPAFKGKKRELVAEDYVYSIKRLFDPKLSAPLLSEVEGIIAGSDALLAKVRKTDKLDYDEPLEGLRALDRYTLQLKLTKPIYTFIYNLADCRVACAVAREVVEHYGDDAGSHPVGTGPYRLAFWKRSSKMVFEANPDYREEYYDAHPSADDADGQGAHKKLQGKRLPLVGKIEVSIIEETQPRWLSFLNGEQDLMFLLPEEFSNTVIPNNQLAPYLQKRGLIMRREPALDLTYAFFNMKDPLVGGYTPEKVALRRAITLGYSTHDEIAIIRKNQAIPAQTPYPPGVAGFDPDFRSNANEYNVAKSRALLDLFGYIDRDGDGYREMPNGSPLVLQYYSPPTARDAQFDELWKRSMDDIGLKLNINKAKWPDLLKQAYQAKLMIWQLAGSASKPDAQDTLIDLYGPNATPKGNLANFQLSALDRLYERALVMPDSPERTRLYNEMTKLVVAYAPWKLNVHRIRTDLWYPWLVGYRRPLVLGDNFWKHIDIDLSVQQVAKR